MKPYVLKRRICRTYLVSLACVREHISVVTRARVSARTVTTVEFLLDFPGPRRFFTVARAAGHVGQRRILYRVARARPTGRRERNASRCPFPRREDF